MASSLTIEEIAELAQVSRSTVSRVLNNHPSVRAVVRERVQAVMREYNYAPNAAARSLASQRTHSIGLLIPNNAADTFADPFFPIVVQRVIEASNRRGYFVMMAMLTHDIEQDFFHQIVRGRHFDGVIMLSSNIDDPMLPLLIRDQVPLVSIGRHPYFDQLHWVDVDGRAGARLGVNHLISLGHTNIATITGSLQMLSGLERRDGYKQALLEAGIAIRPELIVEGNYLRDTAYTSMQQLLQLDSPPTAVFTASDLMAVGALRAIREANLRVPQDIALVSFDDLPLAPYADIPLTTVHQPVAELGASATNLLINQLEQIEVAEYQRRLPFHLVIRESCGASLRSATERDA